MSLPREWSFQTGTGTAVVSMEDVEKVSGSVGLRGRDLERGLLAEVGGVGCDVGIANTANALGGSLFSIHSAPAPAPLFELNVDVDNGSPKRPSSLVMPAATLASNHSAVHVSSPETIDDDDNLLTISSLTAKPLIAKSRELRNMKAQHNRWKRINDDALKCADDDDGTDAPDGGYGWVIVFGAFFVQFWVAGLVKSYGVLFVEVMETYPNSSASVASWIPAILSALCLALAPLSSALCQKYSCRKVVFIGGVFCALGLMLSYFAASLIHLFFTFGILTGIGGGLSTTPGIVIVSQYFNKHRALANGICISGTAAGSFVFPLLIEHLCDNFGFHGTILLLGGCMLHVCVSATLYRPLPPRPATLTPHHRHGPPPLAALSALSVKSSSQLQLPQLISPIHLNNEQLSNAKHLELVFVNDPFDSLALNEPNNKLKKKNMNMNMLNDLFSQRSVLIAESKGAGDSDSEEEKDVIGETILMKPIRSLRSSSILHSVEDLSTDSTCVYKARGYGHSQRERDGLSRSMFLTPHVHVVEPLPLITNSGKEREQQSVCVDTLSDARECIARAEQKGHASSWSHRIGRYLDISLLRNMRFIMMCLSVTLMSTGSPYMLYYLPAYALSTGYSKSEAGYLVAVCAALDLCGRLGLGWLSDLQLFDRRKGYIGSIVGAGVAVLLIPAASSFYVLACSVGMYGLCLGCWFLLVPVLLADLFGTGKISSSYGLVRMFQSIAAISIPPLAGFMRDITGGYEMCFYCMGSCMVLGGVPLLLVPSSPAPDTYARAPSPSPSPSPDRLTGETPQSKQHG